MSPSHRSSSGERGVAVLMTALCLIPLMAFAAFGVDLASFYSRASFLQKSADAASLAGTVWMPDLGKATTVACDSLQQNGIDGGDCGSGPFGIDIGQGATSTSLRVVVTDPDATRYFSQVIAGGDQSITRSAEAEYNLPIPLGSPLNYFGGDATKIPPLSHEEEQTVVNWPSDYSSTAHLPVNVPCNVGSSASQGVGRWVNATTFDPSGFSGSTRCLFEVRQGTQSGTTNTAPPDYDRLTNVPTNVPCNAFASGTNGRWQTGPTWNAGARFNSGSAASGNRQCTWRNWLTSSLPSSAYRSNAANINASVRPCNVGYADQNGRWPASGGYSAGNRFAGLHTAGNQFCQFYADVVTQTVTVPDPNPIESTRSPGFWAAVGGPGDVAAFGDAYSARCTGSTNCGGVPNQNHTDDGYWYVIKMPASSASTTTIRVFDASYNVGSGPPGPAGDTRGSFSSGNGFTTSYRLYKQTHPLDFNQRTALGPGTGNQTPGSCHWALRDQAAFDISWVSFCSLTPSNGDIYLLNVKTSGTSGSTDGVNGYAVEAISSGSVQPAVYAFGTMAMRNNIENGEANFYLAEVGPQYAGRTLVIELFDAGDASGNAYLQPVMPQTALDTWTNIPSNRCAYTSSPSPNPGIFSGSPDGQRTSPPVVTSTQPALANCRIQTTASGTQQFNDSWMQIRVTIPSTYTCTLGKNPEDSAQVAGNCWWGIRYDFSSASANDVTTWRARIEGNPVHLTQ